MEQKEKKIIFLTQKIEISNICDGVHVFKSIIVIFMTCFINLSHRTVGTSFGQEDSRSRFIFPPPLLARRKKSNLKLYKNKMQFIRIAPDKKQLA